MKKIGITTFLSDNYGTCLQAYALQRACGNLGFCSEILDIERAGGQEKPAALLPAIKQLLSDFPRVTPLDYIKVRNAYRRKHDRFLKFQNTDLRKSDEKYYMAQGIGGAGEKYDFFITGSDMVWSEEFSRYAGTFFLQDIPYEKSGSYAPSFGKTEIDGTLRATYQEYLGGIKYLSCRERAGVTLIRNLSGRDAAFVCDPTLLFTKEEWISFFGIPETVDAPVLVNCFGSLPKIFYGQAKLIKKRMGASGIRYLNTGRYDMKIELRHGPADYGPVEFVRMVNGCRFMIVNGYHGLIFALIFEKPFVVLHRDAGEHWREHEERMADLLSYVGLEERYIYADTDISKMELQIDYSRVSKQLEELRGESFRYLNGMLGDLG